MKTIAIIGIGKWGKNLVAEFSQYFKIKYCYSKGDKSNIRWIKKNYPLINYASNLDTILENAQLEKGATVLTYPVKDPERFGVIEFEGCDGHRDSGRVVSIEEKPEIPKSNRALIGIYFFW